jgi:hypothetical protein
MGGEGRGWLWSDMHARSTCVNPMCNFFSAGPSPVTNAQKWCRPQQKRTHPVGHKATVLRFNHIARCACGSVRGKPPKVHIDGWRTLCGWSSPDRTSDGRSRGHPRVSVVTCARSEGWEWARQSVSSIDGRRYIDSRLPSPPERERDPGKSE